mmetsp:Transcript_12673/g.47397  ORF Transcript_12673/g.47397 Transcript_12673/m.47397 type:complete len:255 (-) Transcript_12673:47-811(-)
MTRSNGFLFATTTARRASTTTSAFDPLGASYATTWSAPRRFTKDAFFAEQTPTTCPAFRQRSICTSKCPTPPLAPMTNTRSPSLNRNWRSSCAQVTPGSTNAAACACVSVVGFKHTWSRGTETSSASAPRNGGTAPNTSSPTWKPLFKGACSTTPLRSNPTPWPSIMRLANFANTGGSLSPMTPLASTGLTAHAFTLTSNAVCEGDGRGRLVTTLMPSTQDRSYTAARISWSKSKAPQYEKRKSTEEANSGQDK